MSVPQQLDHLVYATPDLERGIAEVCALLGTAASAGGSHVGLGTRNALLALGPAAYLEIIGPDPEQPAPSRPRPFGIDDLESSRLVTWAVRSSSLDADVVRLRAAGADPGAVVAMSRVRLDGQRLDWRLTLPPVPLENGLMPFLIDWGRSPHPAVDASAAGRLVDLELRSPAPLRLKALLTAMQIDVVVREASVSALAATVETLGGDRVVLQ